MAEQRICANECQKLIPNNSPYQICDACRQEKRKEVDDATSAQSLLFDMRPDWERHWRGMPEFVQEDLEPFKSIQVHFSSPLDMEAFAKLVGQTITPRTRSVWFPEAEIMRYVDKQYVFDPTEVRDDPR